MCLNFQVDAFWTAHYHFPVIRTIRVLATLDMRTDKAQLQVVHNISLSARKRSKAAWASHHAHSGSPLSIQS